MPHRISVKALIANDVALEANVVPLARWPIYILLDMPGAHNPGGSMAAGTMALNSCGSVA